MKDRQIVLDLMKNFRYFPGISFIYFKLILKVHTFTYVLMLEIIFSYFLYLHARS